ncbi:uncharacterized protein LOC133193972 [Saccostrea echinata]|uniref:uncharacterized protein LOC133193972 n=1 Tax=Saccostrea echinata TaxID=191078 RepID=UPI002A82F051|nr:uncharacterized protein LOC133193972 [Saccostrea echinata]
MVPLLTAFCVSACLINLTIAESEASNTTENTGVEEPQLPQLGTDSVVLRQLLNQETLIRMSLTKNVHAMMKDMVSFKKTALSLQSEMSTVKQTVGDEKIKMEKEIEALKDEIQQLKERNEVLEDRLSAQNLTDFRLRAELEKNLEDRKRLEKDLRVGQENFERNTSEILSDIKIQIRVLSMSLMELNKHAQEIDKTVPELIENKYHVVSEMIANVSTSLLEETNRSLGNIRSDLSETQLDQLKLSAAVLSLEWFRNNISSGGFDVSERIGFTVGTTSGNRYWGSGKLVFSSVIFNQGQGYDASSGIFTSPTDGTYVFYVTITAYSSNTINVDIVHDKVSKVRAHAYGSTSHQTGTNMAVLTLSRGDKVWVQYASGGGYYSESVPVTTFSGFMI